MATAFDFKQAVQQMTAPHAEVGVGQVAIWGGKFNADDVETLEQRLARFLTSWDWAACAMPYRIWEYAHRIEFTRRDTPLLMATEHHLLERGRIFGSGGDLSLRRDSAYFHWHFIGRFTPLLRAAEWQAQDFFTTHPNCKFRQHDESALLWGEPRGQKNGVNYWQDDRVGWADLVYPHASTDRLKICYTIFTDGGQAAFVWWKELKTHG